MFFFLLLFAACTAFLYQNTFVLWRKPCIGYCVAFQALMALEGALQLSSGDFDPSLIVGRWISLPKIEAPWPYDGPYDGPMLALWLGFFSLFHHTFFFGATKNVLGGLDGLLESIEAFIGEHRDERPMFLVM